MKNKSRTNHGGVIRGAIKLKKAPKYGKSPKGRGGGVSTKNQKDQNLKFGLFDESGGGYIFIFFPNVNVNFKCFR